MGTVPARVNPQPRKLGQGDKIPLARIGWPQRDVNLTRGSEQLAAQYRFEAAAKEGLLVGGFEVGWAGLVATSRRAWKVEDDAIVPSFFGLLQRVASVQRSSVDAVKHRPTKGLDCLNVILGALSLDRC